MAALIVFRGWGGAALLTDPMLAYVGGVEGVDLHAHQAVQIVVALEEPLALRDGEGRSVHGVAAAIPNPA
jgi:hypothetical protein